MAVSLRGVGALAFGPGAVHVLIYSVHSLAPAKLLTGGCQGVGCDHPSVFCYVSDRKSVV